MNLPLNPFWRNLGIIESCKCQDKSKAKSGCSSLRKESDFIGMWVPGVYFPIFSELDSVMSFNNEESILQ